MLEHFTANEVLSAHEYEIHLFKFSSNCIAEEQKKNPLKTTVGYPYSSVQVLRFGIENCIQIRLTTVGYLLEVIDEYIISFIDLMVIGIYESIYTYSVIKKMRSS